MKKVVLFCLVIGQLVACGDDLVVGSEEVAPTAEPGILETGERLATALAAVDAEGLSATQMNQVYLGSYLVNGVSGCSGCHNSDAGHLAGGNEFPVRFLPPGVDGNTSVFVRNLTPDPETGLKLTESEFIESMRTGKDFIDSEGDRVERLLFMPTHAYRYMGTEDLRAIYAYLKQIPPVRNPLRTTYLPSIPFFPVPEPVLPDSEVDRGLEIPRVFSSGADADAFVTQYDAALGTLSSQDLNQVGRGSYLINAFSDCNGCHTDGVPDGNPDNGLIPQTFDFNTAQYLAGGVNLGPRSRLPIDVFSRNLTSHPETGLKLNEEQFVQVLRFGADFRRPGGSLRITPHFPARFRMTLEDLRAVYAFLKLIPSIDNDVTITP